MSCWPSGHIYSSFYTGLFLFQVLHNLSYSYSILDGTDYKIGLRLSVGTLTVAFLDRFSPKLAQT